MSNLTYEHLHHNLKLLKLTTFESILDNYLEISIKEGKSFIEIIDYLVEQEIQSKEARSKAVRMRIAGFPFNKRLADFDFKYQPSLDKAAIREMASLRFIRNAENIVFLGPPGVGKHIWPLVWVLRLLRRDSRYICQCFGPGRKT